MNRTALIRCFIFLFIVLIIAACGSKKKEQPAEKSPTNEITTETKAITDTAVSGDTSMIEEAKDKLEEAGESAVEEAKEKVEEGKEALEGAKEKIEGMKDKTEDAKKNVNPPSGQ